MIKREAYEIPIAATMNIRIALAVLILSVPVACNTKVSDAQILQWKEEIRETELAFSDLSEKEGVEAAFLAYAAGDAVLMRNNELIKGYDAIRGRFEANPADPSTVTLTWKPDFVEVSRSGDLGYTYGTYTLVTTDSIGNRNTSSGVFHTVWKRQPDGAWKFVWD